MLDSSSGIASSRGQPATQGPDSCGAVQDDPQAVGGDFRSPEARDEPIHDRNGPSRGERLDPIEQARRKPKSLALAIKAQCWECIGSGADPNPRRTIRECRATGCPLLPLRPFQRGPRPKGLSKRKAINAKCRRCMGPDPNVAQRIRECMAGHICPLWPLRPYREATS